MTTRYVDLNCSNAIKRNETNNRYTYKLNQGLELPTGTSVEVQNSLINLQGITGQSIEIEEDIEETILFQYYSLDSSIQAPVVDVGDPAKVLSYNTLVDVRVTLNSELTQPQQLAEQDGGGAYTGTALTYTPENQTNFGFTENIMPMVGVMEIGDDVNPALKNFYLIPMCGEADIRIPKGIYSVNSLSDLISDQINMVQNPDKGKSVESLYEQQRNAGKYKGIVTNNTTNRLIQTMRTDFWDKFLQGSTDADAVISNLNQMPTGDEGNPRVLNKNDADVVAGMAVLPNFNREIMKMAKTNEYEHFANVESPVLINNAFRNTASGGNQGSRRYGSGFVANNGDTDAGFPLGIVTNTYNLFQYGMVVGTTGFNLSYDSDRSGFSFDKLHEPRRIPTHDKRGNALSNPSQECCYTKRVPRKPEIVEGVNPYPGLSQEQIDILANGANALVQRFSGIMIYNFAYKTAKKLANPKSPAMTKGQNTDESDKFYNFDEFFTDDKEAREAWQKTLWARLGFSYDQLVNKDNFETQNQFNVKQYLNGVTTRADVDTSLLPFCSTLFQQYGKAGHTHSGDQAFDLPALPSIQLFNLLDCNVPFTPYNNNLKDADKGFIPNVYSYEASFYDFAVMIPVQVSGRKLVADALPILSKNGYMLVLSNVVDQNDYAAHQSELGIIDLVPKSSLSNQDFIADRNFIQHIISNPKTLNSIDIAIVNPDLTDVVLEPDSTILLKITTPLQKPTILLAQAELQEAETDVEQTLTAVTNQGVSDKLNNQSKKQN